MKSVYNRRSAMTAAMALVLAPSGRSMARSAPRVPTLFPRPFAGSRTVTTFVQELLGHEWLVPIPLARELHIELTRPITQYDSYADEVQRAEVFAWFAIRTIAPRYLRQAGYGLEAENCERQTSLREGALAAATAQHTIGHDQRVRYDRGGVRTFAPPEHFAYGASAYACNSAHDPTCFVGMPPTPVEWIAQSGWQCARALTQSFASVYDGEEADPVESAWVWDAAVSVINQAMAVCLQDEVRT